MAVLTSQFFLWDEGDDVDMPLHINDGRASLQQKVDFNYENKCPQKIERVQKVAEHPEDGPQKWPMGNEWTL